MYSIKGIDAAELRSRLQNRGADKLVLVDVRTPAETVRGVIQGARHIPLHLLPLTVHELPTAHDTAVVFYCQSGTRSAQACAFMSQRGQGNAYNLRGGFLAWQRTSPPVN